MAALFQLAEELRCVAFEIGQRMNVARQVSGASRYRIVIASNTMLCHSQVFGNLPPWLPPARLDRRAVDS